MVTFAQAQERAEEWVNGDVPAYQHREVRVREFELGFVLWAEDRADGPSGGGGGQRLVIARDSGEATLWPGLPVGEVIRRYEEEYGVRDAPPAAVSGAPQRVDLNQTSFLLSPPEWLQEVADGKAGLSGANGARDAVSSGSDAGADADSSAGALGWPSSGDSSAAMPSADVSDSPSSWPKAGVPEGATPWAGTDTNSASDAESVSVPLPATVFAPPLAGSDDDDTPEPSVKPDAATSLLRGGSQLPPTALDPAATPLPSTAPEAPASGPASGSADIADAATSKAAPPRGPRGGIGAPPPPPGAPGTPGARPGGASAGGAPVPPPGAPAGGYVPTQMVPQPGGPGGLKPPAPPGPPGAPGAPAAPPPAPPAGPGDVHHAATMLADPSALGAPQPPAPPAGPGGVHHAATMLAGPGQVGPPMPPPAPGSGQVGPPMPPPAPGSGPVGPPMPPPAPGSGPVGPPMPPPGPGAVPLGGPPPAPGAVQPPPAYGYPQQPTGQPTVGPGYQAVLRYRAQDGSEQQLIRRSAPGTPHPEWQMLHELRAMNVPPQQVLELHTELESCELPGGYCARMIRETWPQVRITSVAPYGKDHASRQQGMAHLLTHQGELHQVADGPARPAPVRAPLPPVQPAPPIPPEGVAQELAQAFGPQGIFRFDQRAVSRQGVPEVVAMTLVWAGLPVDFGPFFWAQAVPGQPVPTLAELAQQRQVAPASDAGSYLVMGSDFGRAICVQYGTANIVAVPVEAGPGGQPVPPQFVNSGLPEFVRSMALLGRMWRLRFSLNPEQAGRWTVDFQAQLAMLDPAALASPESWWSVLLEQMWDGLL
ncbi:SUKH-4 family immunity protein [Streptomyces sp. NBC_01465]|uniref:SUKH-4 family immunity protein n=1 Tax=Streptomyces sp. NBC_01465 TaxID=2903878 RepID=UPI002E32B7F5|nr:SUKH-4 family immunity protein [Streptomyces sp. NBC_01465]